MKESTTKKLSLLSMILPLIGLFGLCLGGPIVKVIPALRIFLVIPVFSMAPLAVFLAIFVNSRNTLLENKVSYRLYNGILIGFFVLWMELVSVFLVVLGAIMGWGIKMAVIPSMALASAVIAVCVKLYKKEKALTFPVQSKLFEVKEYDYFQGVEFGAEGDEDILGMSCTPAGMWQQYDFLIDGEYGWNYILNSAQYIADVDLDYVGTVTVTWHTKWEQQKEYIEEVRANGGRIAGCVSLWKEGYMLGVGGFSRTLGCFVKIVWINHSRRLCIFISGDVRDDMKLFAHHVIRRDFR